MNAFVFDLDGVLVDSYECWRSLVNSALRSCGKPPLSKEKFDLSWGQGPDADQKMFFPEWTVEQVLGFYEREFPQHAKWARREPGIDVLLARLMDKKKLVAVASNSPVSIIECLLDQTDLRAYVRVCVGVEQVKEGKPSPDLILTALAKLGAQASGACYIGDSIFDEQAARSAEVLFIGYRRPGDMTISRFDELTSLLD